MSALDFWLTGLFGWVVISIVTGPGRWRNRTGSWRFLTAFRSDESRRCDQAARWTVMYQAPPSPLSGLSSSRSIPTSTARRVRSSQSIRSSANVRVAGPVELADVVGKLMAAQTSR